MRTQPLFNQPWMRLLLACATVVFAIFVLGEIADAEQSMATYWVLQVARVRIFFGAVFEARQFWTIEEMRRTWNRPL